MKIFRSKLSILITVSILLAVFISASLDVRAGIADESANYSIGTTKNIALGKKCIASGVEGTATPVKKANDGNPRTRWASKHTDNSWIYVDLGKKTKFNKIVLKWEQAFAKSFKIQISNDAVKWTDIYCTNAGHDYIYEIDTEYKTARYVKMKGLKRATPYGYSLFEFEIYNDPYTITAMNKASKDIVWESYANNYADCINIKNKYIAIDENGFIRTSGDTVNWKTAYLKNTPKIIKVSTLGDRFLAFSTAGSIYYSTDGYNWSMSSYVLPGGIRKVYRANGVLFLLMWNKSIIYSRNGVSWNKLSLDTGKRSLKKIAYSGGQFEIFCNELIGSREDRSEPRIITYWIYGNYKYVSSDLKNWKEVTLNNTEGDYDYSKYFASDISADKIVSMRNDEGTILYGTCNDLGFNRVIKVGKLFFAFRTHDELPRNNHYVSTDGFKWVKREFGIAYNGKTFIATDYNCGLLESKDGLSWRKTEFPDTLKSVFEVWSCGSRFLLSGIKNNLERLLYVSSDGLNWTLCVPESDPHFISTGEGGVFSDTLNTFFTKDGLNHLDLDFESIFDNFDITMRRNHSGSYEFQDAAWDGKRYILQFVQYVDDPVKLNYVTHNYFVLKSTDLKEWSLIQKKNTDCYSLLGNGRVRCGRLIGRIK